MVLDKIFVRFRPARKLGTEFCALFGYGLRSLSQVLFESSEIIFEKAKKICLDGKFSAHFCIFTNAIRNSKLGSLFICQLVDQKLF